MNDHTKKKTHNFPHSMAILVMLCFLCLGVLGVYILQRTEDTTPITYQETPIFSADSGFYDEAFSLTIEANPKATIYYTTDSSDPRTSATRQVYTGAITIDDCSDEANVYAAIDTISKDDYIPPADPVAKCMVVRACSEDGEGNCSDVTTATYFVGDYPAYYGDLQIVTLISDAANLFGTEGIYTNYGVKGLEVEAFVQFFTQGTLDYETACGIRIAGAASRYGAQKSIRLCARGTYGDKKFSYTGFENLVSTSGTSITSFDKLKLYSEAQTDTRIATAVVNDAIADLDLTILACTPCVLFLDGEYWGMYWIMENLDADTIAAHYDLDPEDVTLIKCNQLEDGTEEAYEEYVDFYTWALTADMTEAQNYETLCAQMDIQSLMEYVALEMWLSNGDWFYGNTTQNNWGIWKTSDSPWRFIVYDIEESMTDPGQEVLCADWQDAADNPTLLTLFYHLLYNDSFRSEFYDTYVSVVTETLASDRMLALIKNYDDRYREAIIDTLARYETEENVATTATDTAETNADAAATTATARATARYTAALTTMEDFCTGRSTTALASLETLMATYAAQCQCQHIFTTQTTSVTGAAQSADTADATQTGSATSTPTDTCTLCGYICWHPITAATCPTCHTTLYDITIPRGKTTYQGESGDTAFVTRLINLLFLREVNENDSLDHYVYYLENGYLTRADLVGNFLSSTEFSFYLYTDQQYVCLLYRALVDDGYTSPADAQEYLDLLDAGYTTEEILARMLDL